ncbi:ArsR/SmtB family transcription factor [Methylobacterium sp. A54F]
MKDGPVIAAVAALVGDPARANMLTALMDGRALTVSELAQAAGVTLPTASGHLARLDAAGLVVAERQGRHRYHRLSGHDVAQVLEGLMGLAQRTGAVRARTGPRDPALREARVCYDHLAGARGVMLMRGLAARGWIEDGAAPGLTPRGRAALCAAGIDVPALERGRRPLCRACLDWSERRSHLGGALGAALLDHVLARRWARRGAGRVVAFSPAGLAAFGAAFGPAAQAGPDDGA